MAPYLVALLLVVASVVVGSAVCRACRASTVAAAPVGLSVLLALSALAVRLPGDAVTAALAAVIAVVAAVLVLVLVRGRERPRVDPVAVGAGALALGVVSLQFVSAGRIGLPGMSLNNDTAVHLLWAEGLRSDLMAGLYPSNPGYPLGPHAVLATVAQATGADMDAALTGLLLATPVLTAITAAAVLRPMPALLRLAAATTAAVPYLLAAWFAQGAFKEPLMALLLLGWVAGAGAALEAPGRPRAAALVPLGLLAAGALLTYSYLAVAWFGASAAIMVVLTIVLRLVGPRGIAAGVRAAALPVAVGLGAAVVAAAVELPRVWRYATAVGASPASGEEGIDSSSLGNLAGPLKDGIMLNQWPAGDFRFAPPADAALQPELRVLAVVALVVALVVLVVRRRGLALVAGLGGAVALWLLSDRTQSPYVTAKSMVIVAPFVALVTLRALLPEALPRDGRARAQAAIGALVAAVLVVGGLWSAEKVLRDSPVESVAHRDQLEALRADLDGQPTLFLGVDDYAGWRLRGTRVAYTGVGFPAPVLVPGNPSKPYAFGNDVDWDTVDPAGLDAFRNVITLNSPYASAAPPNFRAVRRTPLYVLWRRTGPTAPRQTADPGDAPVARLECRTDANARRLTRRKGVGSVMTPAPVVLQGAVPPLWTGSSYAFATQLPRGRWRLAVKYTSAQPVRVMYGPQRVAELPANTTRIGGWWPAGTIASTGRPQQMVLIAERENRLSETAFPAAISGVVATGDGPERVVALRRACGQALDWYRLGPS